MLLLSRHVPKLPCQTKLQFGFGFGHPSLLLLLLLHGLCWCVTLRQGYWRLVDVLRLQGWQLLSRPSSRRSSGGGRRHQTQTLLMVRQTDLHLIASEE